MSDSSGFSLETLHGKPEFGIPPPTGCDYNFLGNLSPVLTGGGFFTPINAPDDIDGVLSLQWDAISESELERLENDNGTIGTEIQALPNPLELHLFGFLKNLDYQTLEGRVDKFGLPMYSATAEYQITHVDWPDSILVIPPSNNIGPNLELNIGRGGKTILKTAGQKNTVTDENGWIRCDGGDTEPWGPVVPPTSGGDWDRSQRDRTNPLHGISANYLALDSSKLHPVRGAVMLAFSPVE